MKLIFLDSDGVLNYPLMTDPVKKYYGQVSAHCVELLNQLTDETGAKLVISSTWRRDSASLPSIEERLKELGVTGEIIGSTPVLTQKAVFRGNEIYHWMLDNKEICGTYPNLFSDYVILDDDSDMLLWQKDNFVQTDAWIGITPTIIHRAKRVLNRSVETLL